MTGKVFNQFIRELREKNGLPLRKVAASIDIDPSTLSKIERGERVANPELVDRIADVFGINKEELRVMHLSDKVAYDLLQEEHSDQILQVAEEKIKYFRQIKSQQGKIDFEQK